MIQFINEFFKLLKPEPLGFANRADGIKDYINKKARLFAEIFKQEFREYKGGVAYSYFLLETIGFNRGTWGPYSPSFFWNLNINERSRTILSSILYYKLWNEVPSFTILWGEKLSSIFPYNILIRFSQNQSESFCVSYDNNEKIIIIKFNQEVYEKLSNILSNIACQQYNFNNDLIQSQISPESELFTYNFKSIENIEKNFQIENKDSIETSLNEFVPTLSSKLENTLLNLGNVESEEMFDLPFKDIIEQLSKALLRLFLIGPNPPKFLRLLNPKQYIVGNRYIGTLIGILRLYSDLDSADGDKINNIYFIGYSILSKLGFELTSNFFYNSILSHALRSAVAAIMARNMSHIHGSHIEPGIQHKMDTFKEVITKRLSL